MITSLHTALSWKELKTSPDLYQNICHMFQIRYQKLWTQHKRFNVLLNSFMFLSPLSDPCTLAFYVRAIALVPSIKQPCPVRQIQAPYEVWPTSARSLCPLLLFTDDIGALGAAAWVGSELGVREHSRHMALVLLLIPCFAVGTDIAFSCQNADDFVGASSPGDIVIGGLFAVHSEMLHPEEEPIRPVIQNCAGWVILEVTHIAKKRPLTLGM